MNLNMKTKIIIPLIALLASWGLGPIQSAIALDCSSQNLTAQESIQCGTNGASGNNQNADTATKRVNSTIDIVVNVLSAIVGVIAVIMIVFGGFRYITSAGNAEKAKTARNVILYAVIGLVIVALAQVIVKFTLNEATKPLPKTSMFL
jgi:cytochrome bd-type quinol oxidase subunit 2